MTTVKSVTSLTLNEERWFMPPIASVIMGSCTLPLDMIKVQLQAERTLYEGKSIFELIAHIIEERGFTGLYAGYSALVVAQFVYATVRFTIYKLLKKLYMGWRETYSFMASWPDTSGFWVKVVAGGIAGALGGLIGNPPGLVTVRMQNDLKQPPEKRRNYKHVFHAFWVIVREEGVLTLMTGGLMGVYRGIGMTIGQLSIYEQVKQLILFAGFKNSIPVHIFCSCVAGTAATILTNPIDVMKTRIMTSPPGKFKNLWQVIAAIAQEGICTFYKGMTPAFVRQIINTIIMWVVLEQFKIHWGIPPKETLTTSTAILTTLSNYTTPSSSSTENASD